MTCGRRLPNDIKNEMQGVPFFDLRVLNQKNMMQKFDFFVYARAVLTRFLALLFLLTQAKAGSPGPDQSVTFQNNPAHDGYNPSKTNHEV